MACNFGIVFNFILILAIQHSINTLDLKGSGDFYCPKMASWCKKSADIVLPGGFTSECTKLGLANNISKELKTLTPSCYFAIVSLGEPDEKIPDSFNKGELDQGIWCQSDSVNINFHEECIRKRTPQEQDLFDTCKAFGTTDKFEECKPDMFQIIKDGRLVDFALIDKTTNNDQSEYTSLKIKEVDCKFKTLLQRSCLYFKQTGENECSCDNFEVTNGTFAMDFCQETKPDESFVAGFEALCALINKTLDDCDCKLFNLSDNTTKQSVCDFLQPKPVQNLIQAAYFLLPYATVETVASVIGIIGNLIVIAVAVRFRIGLAPCKMLIAHLALYDLFFAIFQFTYALPKFWVAKFIYGKFVCRVLRGAEYLGVYLAIGVILTISIERFIGIVNPFSRGISKTGLNVILFINGLCGLMACIPIFYYSSITDLGICEVDWPNGSQDMFIYNMFVLIVYLLIPTIIIATLYSLIISTLHGTIVLGKNSFIADPRLRKKRLQDNRRTMYVLIGVVIAFVIFVFPKQVIMTFLSYNDYGWGSFANQRDMKASTFVILVYIAHFTYPFHVSINPLVYSLIDARWRKDVRNFFTGHNWRNRSAYSATMSSTMTQRRRSSVATVLDDPCTKRKSPPTVGKLNPNINNNNNISRPRQLVVTATATGKFETLPTPLTSSDELWIEENGGQKSKFTFLT